MRIWINQRELGKADSPVHASIEIYLLVFQLGELNLFVDMHVFGMIPYAQYYCGYIPYGIS